VTFDDSSFLWRGRTTIYKGCFDGYMSFVLNFWYFLFAGFLVKLSGIAQHFQTWRRQLNGEYTRN
jgi:hypothetical protein